MEVLGQGDLVLQSERRKARKPGNGGPGPKGPCTTIGKTEGSETRKWGSWAQGDLVLQSERRKARKPGNGGPRPRGPCTTIGKTEGSETRKWGSWAKGTLYYNRKDGRLGNPKMGVLGQGDLVLQWERRKARKPGNGGPRPRGACTTIGKTEGSETRKWGPWAKGTLYYNRKDGNGGPGPRGPCTTIGKTEGSETRKWGS
jgi:hypothetical protein